MPLERLEKAGIRLRPFEKARERAGVAHLEIAWVSLSQEPDVSWNAGGDDRHGGRQGFGYGIGPAFHPRRDHHEARAREDAQGLRARKLAEPFVAPVSLLLSPRAPGHLRAHGPAHLKDADTRRGRQEPRGERRAEGVLHRAEVREDADVEEALRPARPAPPRFDRLVDHHALATKLRRQSGHTERLEENEVCGEAERALRLAALLEIAVQIGPRENDDERKVGMVSMKAIDGIEAAPRVERDQEITALATPALPDRDAVTETAKDPRPAQGRRAVARVGSTGRRGADEDADPMAPFESRHPVSDHSASSGRRAHVRKPAQTSRRSGV